MRNTRLLQVMATALGILCSLTSYAGISIEPLAGYNGINKFDSGGSKEYKSGAGIGYGGKLAWEKDKKSGVSAGLDYLRSDIDMSSSDFDSNLRTDEWGAYVGIKLPVLFKFYGEYIFAAYGSTKVANQNIHLSSGVGWKAGVGCTILPFLDLNFDYREVTYGDRDIGVYMLSLSLPIHLFE